MAKEVTVLSIEGSFLRGVRLEEQNGAFECADVESWPLAEEAPETAAEASGAHEEGVLAAPPSDDAPVETVMEEDKPLARALTAAVKQFGQSEFTPALPLPLSLVGIHQPSTSI